MKDFEFVVDLSTLEKLARGEIPVEEVAQPERCVVCYRTLEDLKREAWYGEELSLEELVELGAEIKEVLMTNCNTFIDELLFHYPEEDFDEEKEEKGKTIDFPD